MKKFMVVYEIDGVQNANFFDQSDEAESFRLEVVCGIGGHAEVYKRQRETAKELAAYEFIYS